MSLLRPLSILLRNFLVKQHPYFSCCASCGEIATPIENRLCTSLKADFAVDAVFLGTAQAQADIGETARQLEDRLPWLRSLCFLNDPGQGQELPSARARRLDSRILAAKQQEYKSQGKEVPLAALLHELPDLADCYLVFTERQMPGKPLAQLDFYTPNGIPLLAAGSFAPVMPNEHSDESALYETVVEGVRALAGDSLAALTVYPHTKDASRDFLAFLLEYMARTGEKTVTGETYSRLLPQWLYSSGRGVPVPRGWQL